MDIFPENHVIRFIDGTECVVKIHLETLGLRSMYGVVYGPSACRLVWNSFTEFNTHTYRSVFELYKSGAPSDCCEWPLAVTDNSEEGFGYLIPWIPDGYVDLSTFRVGRVRFHTPELMLTACKNIVESFRQLHQKGFCYHNVDDQCIYVNPSDGGVFLCSPEYMSEIGTRSSFVHAPYITSLELLNGGNADVRSDFFSLAYMLFGVIYGISPFAGRLMYEYVQSSMAHKAYVFIMDPEDERNRVPFNFEVLKKKWASSPDVLRNAFIRAFSSEAIREPQKRISADEWNHIFRQTSLQCVRCPECGRSTFVNISSEPTMCMMCGKQVRKFPLLKIGKYEIPLVPGQNLEYGHIYQDSCEVRVYASVVTHPQHPDRWGIQNMSDHEWTVQMNDGTVKSVLPGKIMPATLNVKVAFASDMEGVIVY